MNSLYSDVMLLVQFSAKLESRTFVEYNSLRAALNGICQLYEQALKESEPGVRKISYNMNDLFMYLDKMHKIILFLYHPPTRTYKVHDKIWLKDKLVKHVQGQIKDH